MSKHLRMTSSLYYNDEFVIIMQSNMEVHTLEIYIIVYLYI